MSSLTEEDTVASQPVRRLPSAASGMCQIPQELRDIIFHELWETTPLIHLKQKSFVDDGISITLSYGPRKTDQLYSTSGLPRWLLTSKAFLQEGLSQLFRHAVWGWYDNHSLHATHASHSNPLAGLSVATNFAVLDHAFLHNRRAKTEPSLYRLERICQPVEIIVPLLSSKLRVLDLNLRIQMHHEDTYALELSRFGSPNLQLAKLKVCLRLKLAALSCSIGERDSAYAAFLAQAESEVAQIGRAWVGEARTSQLEEVVSWFSADRTRHERVYVKGDPADVSRRHHITFTVVKAET